MTKVDTSSFKRFPYFTIIEQHLARTRVEVYIPEIITKFDEVIKNV